MEEAPAPSTEVFLRPGEVCFGGRGTRIRTILGSCVAITAWHPRLHIGGMCHYMLPSRRESDQARPHQIGAALDGKYADEALELMLSHIKGHDTRLAQYQIKLFGGGDMLQAGQKTPAQCIGRRNAQAGMALLAAHGVKANAEHLGGCGHRTLVFDLDNGDAWVRQYVLDHSPCANCTSSSTCPQQPCQPA